MVQHHRLTIRPIDADPRANEIASAAESMGLGPIAASDIRVADLIFVEGDLSQDDLHTLHGFLVDPLLQQGSWQTPGGAGTEITFLPGVTDYSASTLRIAADRLGVEITGAATGRRVEFGDGVAPEATDEIIRRVVANPVIERWESGSVEPVFHVGAEARFDVEHVDLAGLSPEQLVSLGNQRSLALDQQELEVIQAHFAEIGRAPTDVELEALAQTWSEHCSHKTFRAVLHCDDGEDRTTLLEMLRQSTEAIDAPFVKSSFVGNAGVISFFGDATYALKAETHNHPSAIEPFGGANTGVGGVIRDILGIGHKPIAVTDVLCFGHPDTPSVDVPHGAIHPLRIREGVIAGVADYGNKIGLPTVAGAILYDQGYTTNPLVFAGCIGTANAWEPSPGPQPGDRVILLGGRTGRDGIRGATFSSATMDATTGEVAGASVQIGEPIIEKLLIDVIIGAEDLYRDITDCGAGGLSSAIGEMAEGVGAIVNLDLVPLKYPGLAPWEVWLSEAQERMVLAVPPEHIAELQDRCDYYGVELSDLGSFSGDGQLVVQANGHTVLDLDTEFLHDGRPQRHLEVSMPRPERSDEASRSVDDPAQTLLDLLRHRNIASKADTIHRYDVEILGSTALRPIIGRLNDAPADGVVIADPESESGIAIGIGVNPWYGEHDPEAMAYVAVDEAIRNVVAVGADPQRVALLDNFSWGDPTRPETLGALVAAVDGACSAAMAFRAPFVSGKDSLNNEYTGKDGLRHAVPPTLVITAVGAIDNVADTVTPTLKSPGNQLVMVGTTEAEFAGSHLDLILGEPDRPGVVPRPDPDSADRYRDLHHAIESGLVRACHDVSEGGLAVALAEMCIGGRLGAHITNLPHADPTTALFSESSGRLIVEVRPDDLSAFGKLLHNDYSLLGEVTEEGVLHIEGIASISVDDLTDAFVRHAEPPPGSGDDSPPASSNDPGMNTSEDDS